MSAYLFVAYALEGELDLNRLGATLGLARKFRWEEPMVLNPLSLYQSADVRLEGPSVHLYSFGAVVFVNCDDVTIASFSRAMTGVSRSFKDLSNVKYQERYLMKVDPGGKPAVTNDYASMPLPEPVYIDIIASVIAKSVALERIEEQVDALVDEIESIITLLGQGKLNISGKKLAQIASKILNHRYRSIAYVMVLDKPEVTWENQEADTLYRSMANQFEISLRYQEIRHKSETLMDITDVFATLSHARRSSQLEWIIIVLIFIEIVIFLFQIMH